MRTHLQSLETFTKVISPLIIHDSPLPPACKIFLQHQKVSWRKLKLKYKLLAYTCLYL